MKRISYFNLYVIKGENGDVLIDTGFIGMKRKIKKWLDNFNIKLVVLTHAHPDHIWNASYIKKLYNCDIAISELDLENINNKNMNPKPSLEKYTRWCNIMKWGMKKFISQKFDVDILLKDNQVLDNYGIKIVSLPGHTNGSIGVLYKNYLFAGDALVNRGKISIAYQNQDNDEAINTYDKIINMNPKMILFGHDKPCIIDSLK